MVSYRTNSAGRAGSYRSLMMHVLGLQKTIRLWDRLYRESGDHYRTLHDARNQMRRIGPNTFSDLAATFSDLQRQHTRLKRRFIVMAVIGRSWVLPVWGSLSGHIRERGVWIFGLQGWSDLMRESDNVRLR